MTEYDFSPGAYARQQAKLMSVGRWRDNTDTIRTGPPSYTSSSSGFGGLKDPFTPATPHVLAGRELAGHTRALQGLEVNDSVDLTRERLSTSSRDGSRRRGKSRHRDDYIDLREREHEREQYRPKTAPPRGDVYGQYIPPQYPGVMNPQPTGPVIPIQPGPITKYISPPATPSPLSPNYQPAHYSNYSQPQPVYTGGFAGVPRPTPVKSSSYYYESPPKHGQPKRAHTLQTMPVLAPNPVMHKPVIPPTVPLTKEDLKSSSSLTSSSTGLTSSSLMTGSSGSGGYPAYPTPVSPVSPAGGKKSGSPLLKRVFGGFFGGGGHERSKSASISSTGSSTISGGSGSTATVSPGLGSATTRGYVFVDQPSPQSRRHHYDDYRSSDSGGSGSGRGRTHRDDRDRDYDKGHRRSKSTHQSSSHHHKSSRHHRDRSSSRSRSRERDRHRDKDRDRHKERDKPKRRDRRNSVF